MKEKKSLRKKGFLFIFFIWILSCLIFKGPDFLAYIQTTDHQWYTGQVPYFDPWDVNAYFGAIGWGKRDGLLYENLYDNLSQEKLPVFTFYTLLGKIFSVINLPNWLIFHLSSIFLNLGLILVIWSSIGFFLPHIKEKKITLWLLIFGGGLGWLVFPRFIGADIGLPTFSLYRAFNYPHEALSSILFLLTLINLWRGSILRQKKKIAIGALSSFLLFFIHPYLIFHLTIIFMLTEIYWWAKNRSLDFLKPILILGFSGGVYFLLAGRYLWQSKTFFALTRVKGISPPFIALILGWGILLPFIIKRLISVSRKPEDILVKIWFLAYSVVLFLPFFFENNLLKGISFPAIILAGNGLTEFLNQTKKNRAIVGLIIFVTSFSTIFILLTRIFFSPQTSWTYLTADEGKTIEYLRNHGQNEETVLAGMEIANLIPAQTNKRVFAGHGLNTPEYPKRYALVEEFFKNEMEDAQAQKFFQDAKISWIFWGPKEKTIGNLTEIPNQNLLEFVSGNEITSLYRIK